MIAIILTCSWSHSMATGRMCTPLRYWCGCARTYGSNPCQVVGRAWQVMPFEQDWNLATQVVLRSFLFMIELKNSKEEKNGFVLQKSISSRKWKKKLDIFWKDHLFVVGKKLFHVPKGSHLTSCTFASILLKFFKVAIALLSLQPKKNSWWRISTKKKHTQTGHHTNFAPWKINMEPTNQPFGKENDLNQTYMRICSMLIFRGVSRIKNRGSWIHNMLPKFNSSPLKSYHLPPFFRGKLAVF